MSNFKSNVINEDDEEAQNMKLKKPIMHKIWNEGNLKYLINDDWSKVSKQSRQRLKRQNVYGVEVRDLKEDHFLYGTGQQALFATKKFEKFDIVGEYTGEIVNAEVTGEYVATLEDIPIGISNSTSLGVNALNAGNELRFINCYLNIAERANVIMKTGYIDSFPRIIIVCKHDIEIGEELLLDYGPAYNEHYLGQKPKEIIELNNNNNNLSREEEIKINLSVTPIEKIEISIEKEKVEIINNEFI